MAETAPMTAGSWWVALDRDTFRREIALREEDWRRKRVGSLDYVGQKLRENWDLGPPNKWQTR